MEPGSRDAQREKIAGSGESQDLRELASLMVALLGRKTRLRRGEPPPHVRGVRRFILRTLFGAAAAAYWTSGQYGG